MVRFIRLVFTAVMLVSLTSCSQEPYIYQEGEFDRSRPDFAVEQTDRTELQICYFKPNTTPQDLLAMAGAECARFGKIAVFKGQDLLNCPIFTPARANFRCALR